jgi:hypothetical protein
MLTGGICVLQKYNAIHNISIPRGKRLFGGDVGAIS